MMASKRKGDAAAQDATPAKRRNVSTETTSAHSAFRQDLFYQDTVSHFRTAYKDSGPYPHAVVSNLINESLLRDVRSEASEHIHFTLKETDIYRIHQSGDLANLSNLDADSLKRLPSLVKLRNALYSSDFRQWVSHVTGAGPLSGTRTDMAVNVYLPGCYLLCHDDVIGSRRVSYILYLTDPDRPWKPEWGGGLRLFPTELRRNTEGEEVKVPLADHTVNIPPSFSQLSFFAVRPGESYHDVEEVYHRRPQDGSDEDGGRVRMAISGWFHVPQQGEDGFEEGVEQAQAQRSTLAQLKSGAQQFDEPQLEFRAYDEARQVMNSTLTNIESDPPGQDDLDPDILTEQDLTFLLHYLTPSYLTPDLIEQLSASFENTSFVQLDKFFNDKFATDLKEYITKAEAESLPLQWPVARPPHKHRFAYLHSSEQLHRDDASPIARILSDLLHSHAFKKWLALVTAIKPGSLIRQDALARRFRRGKDYALASPYVGEQPQLEFTIGMTPTSGWERELGVESQAPEYGGEEVYMAGDDDDDESVHSTSLPQVGRKADPAVYKATGDDDDDGILFTNAPSWNTFSLVLRDKGTLRFVKYVSQAAQGDRWDIKAEVQLADDAFDGEDDDGQPDQPNGDTDEDGQDFDSDSAPSPTNDQAEANGDT
ncbi:hypothetical protein DV737_g4133, partial [Chaetothyriales sp. CBS 132003]